MTRIVPLSEAKLTLSRLVADVVLREDEVIVTRNGRPAAVLLNAGEYERWKETQEILADPELMREIQEHLKAIQQGQGTRYRSVDDLFGPYHRAHRHRASKDDLPEGDV